jgi:hypothetical protein
MCGSGYRNARPEDNGHDRIPNDLFRHHTSQSIHDPLPKFKDLFNELGWKGSKQVIEASGAFTNIFPTSNPALFHLSLRFRLIEIN